jgi:ribosomal protein L16 Arg81 hydroxylase
LHRDDADVFVVQTAGSKTWRVHEGVADGRWGPGPVSGDPPAEVLHTELSAGEVLYIPRGFAHQAVAGAGLSAHLSVTVREVDLAGLCRTLQRVSLAGLALQPRPVGDDSLLETAASLLAHAREELASLGPEALVRHARAHELSRMPGARRPLSLIELPTAAEAGRSAA